MGVTGSPTGGMIMKRGWGRGMVGLAIRRLRRTQWSSGNRWRFVLGEIAVARGLVTVHESAGRRNPGPLPLHDEPDDESGEHSETDDTSNDTSSNGTSVGTSPTSGTARIICRSETVTLDTGAARIRRN
jgi:hypothetical protein